MKFLSLLLLLVPSLLFADWFEDIVHDDWPILGAGRTLVVSADTDSAFTFLMQSIACLKFYEKYTGNGAFSLLWQKTRNLAIFSCSPLRASCYTESGEEGLVHWETTDGFSVCRIMIRENWYGDGSMPEYTTLYHELMHMVRNDESWVREMEGKMKTFLLANKGSWTMAPDFYKTLPLTWSFE